MTATELQTDLLAELKAKPGAGAVLTWYPKRTMDGISDLNYWDAQIPGHRLKTKTQSTELGALTVCHAFFQRDDAEQPIRVRTPDGVVALPPVYIPWCDCPAPESLLAWARRRIREAFAKLNTTSP